MVEFGTKSAALSADVAQVGQDVADQGIIKTLLPPEKEAALSQKVSEVQQTFAQAKDAIDSVRNFMGVFQAIPFIQTPSLDDHCSASWMRLFRRSQALSSRSNRALKVYALEPPVRSNSLQRPGAVEHGGL